MQSEEELGIISLFVSYYRKYTSKVMISVYTIQYSAIGICMRTNRCFNMILKGLFTVQYRVTFVL